MLYKVIVETGVIDHPNDHEIKAALIAANGYFKSDVLFLRPGRYSTPDIDVNGRKWEIKSPLGNGKKTIENNLRSARKQSENLIIDFGRMKLHQTKAIRNIKFYLEKSPRKFTKVILITKSKKIIEIK
jgi:hypothetical protein